MTAPRRTRIESAPSPGFSSKLIGIVVVCVCLGFASMTVVAAVNQERHLTDLARDQDVRTTELLAAQIVDSVRWKNVAGIERVYKALSPRDTPTLTGLIAFDVDGHPLTTYQSSQPPRLDLSGALDAARTTLERGRTFVKLRDGHFVVVAPLAAANSPAVVGYLAAAWSLDHLRDSISATVIGQVVVAGAALVALIMVMVLLLNHIVTRPLQGLTAQMIALAQGDRSVEFPANDRDDEIGAMARALQVFKQNAIQLEKTQRELEVGARALAIHDKELSRLLKQEQQHNSLQREFVSMASHEFRTPLAIIDGTAQRILRRLDNMTGEDLTERIGRIREAVARMTGLIDSTLIAARLEAGTIEMNSEPCDLASLIVQVAGRQQEIDESHEISVSLDELPEIMADPGRLDQVFTNLLSNAVKYAPKSPRIEIRGWTQDGNVLIAVRDYGLGIPADDLPRLFQRYFRARTSTGIAGTGIGLNLAKNLVELHGGSIDVESIVGEGSTFTVSLPIIGPDNAERDGLAGDEHRVMWPEATRVSA